MSKKTIQITMATLQFVQQSVSMFRWIVSLALDNKQIFEIDAPEHGATLCITAGTREEAQRQADEIKFLASKAKGMVSACPVCEKSNLEISSIPSYRPFTAVVACFECSKFYTEVNINNEG